MTKAVKTQSRFAGVWSRMRSMLKLDFYRLLHTPLLYLMIGISALIPALVLTMVGMNEQTGAQTFTNVWQVVELVRGGNSGMGLMDMATMCNINMVFIFVAVFVSIFVSHDYSSGFIKNIFTVHSKKVDYTVSKSVAGIFGGVCMIAAYLFGAIIVGAIMGKSFALGDASALNVILCCFSKMCLMLIFVPLYLTVSVLFKQRLWLSIIGAFALGILFYPVAMMSAPLNASFFNLIGCIVGGAALGIAFGAVATLILRKRDLA